MSTIITVHGTFATGPQTGELWWQNGSPFETHIKQLVASENGALEYQPFIWDGLNSEKSRRSAGRALCARMEALERQGKPFIVVGHSHGGSVIGAALMEGARRRQRFDHMASWLTIGTPFIATARNRFLFQRLGVLGKSVYVGLLAVFLGLMLMLPKWALADGVKSWLFSGREPKSVCTAESYWTCIPLLVPPVILGMVPFALFYFILRYIESRNVSLYNGGAVAFAESTYRHKWYALWHKNDEAVTALSSLKQIKLDILAKHFAVSLLSWLSLLSLPVLYFLVISWSDFMRFFGEFATSHINTYPSWVNDPHHQPPGLPGGGASPWENHFFMFETFVMAVMERLGGWSTWFWGLSLLLTGTLLSALAVGIALALTAALGLLWQGVSGAMSRLLNPVITSQFQAQGFGSDTSVDAARDAHVWPMWLGKGFPPLPEALGSELQATSDDAIREVVPKFRDAARTFAAATTGREKSDMISDYLTWNELVHTSYFNNARFRKLVAFAAAQADGFVAADALRQDPEYAAVARWYGEIAATAASDGAEP